MFPLEKSVHKNFQKLALSTGPDHRLQCAMTGFLSHMQQPRKQKQQQGQTVARSAQFRLLAVCFLKVRT